jgi:heme/copper-type cytochrome/quinol oxidase subunit 1
MGENKTPGEHQPSKRAKLPAAVVPVLGIAAVLIGCLVAYLNRDFTGWVAYAPLSNQPFSANGAAFITQGTQVGLAVAGVGLLVLAFWAGLVAGRRPGTGPR